MLSGGQKAAGWGNKSELPQEDEMWALLLMSLLVGVQAGVHQGEIVGGHIAPPHSKPWMACLWSKEANIQVCGGFLVHERFVMTAAHCISDFSDIRVVLGVQNWKKPEPSWQTFEKVTPYFSNYNKRNYGNDIVLLKLHRPATLDKYVKLLPLPGNDQDIPEGTRCNVAGWGKTTLDGQQSPDLREVNVTILSNEHCANALGLEHIAKTRLCAGLKGKAKDAYEYDSGGALVCDGVAEGIVSVGTKKSPPGIYTRIAKYIEWIRSTLKRAD